MDKKYQIFISSTYDDLKDARRKVQDAILSMYQFPIGMEMFSAADEEQWKIIRETIDSTDYYVLILGQRYGSVIDSGEDAGISYTEKEFRYANDNGIPILVFIIDDSVPLLPKDIESDGEKREKLNAFKSVVKTGRMVEWWKTPEDLAQKVTIALYKAISHKKRPGWIRSDEFNIEKSHAEILRLNEQIRELEAENRKLKAQVVEREPKLEIGFLLDEPKESEVQSKAGNDDDENKERDYYSHKDLLLNNDNSGLKLQLIPISVDSDSYRAKYEPLTKSDLVFYPELRRYIPNNAIQEYNDALPDEDTINRYLAALVRYNRIQQGGVTFNVYIKNIGTANATDVNVYLDFPEEILVYNVKKLKRMEEPPMPKMPPNPIEEAEKKRLHLTGSMSEYFYQTALPSENRIIPALDVLSDLHGSSDDLLIINTHSLKMESAKIQHYDLSLFNHVYIVPTAKGKFRIECRIMCSEYKEPDIKYIDVEVV